MFRFEQNRLNTFHQWNVPFIDKHILASCGFYYLGPGDLVKCYFCNVEIGQWTLGDDVPTEHRRWFPNCPMVRGYINSDTIPVDPGIDVTGNNLPGASVLLLRNDKSNIDVKHPEYRTDASRLASFEDWPKALNQKPSELSHAGFYYTGKGDKVICFACGGGMKDWEPNDVPWEQHAICYSDCQYLNRMKGAFVKPVRVRFIVTHEETHEETHDCTICLTEKYNSVFVPCGHVCVCVKCAFSVTKCPICRNPYTDILKIYFS